LDGEDRLITIRVEAVIVAARTMRAALPSKHHAERDEYVGGLPCLE